MQWVLFSMAALAALWATERTTGRVGHALAAVAVLAALLALPLGDVERALALAALLAATVAGASLVKYHHSGAKLVAADLALVAAGTIPFMLTQYRRTARRVIAAVLLLLAACLATLGLGAGEPLSLLARVLLLAAAAATLGGLTRGLGGAAHLARDTSAPHGVLSTFFASLQDVGSWKPSRRLRLLDVSAGPRLPLLAPVPPRSERRPDILVIQHESLFDPALYGLEVEPEVRRFLTPEGALAGKLGVDIYGGGSWRSELSLLTGIASASFGADAYFIQTKGIGRFRHTLPGSLAAIGYRTALVSSCRRGFLNYDAFYAAMGVAERLFTDDLPPPFDAGRFDTTSSDALFLPAALEAVRARAAADAAPRFTYVLTNFNHGPHDCARTTTTGAEAARRFARASLGDAEYAEYYARLQETAATWARLRDDIRSVCRERPLVVVHYGDHQPVMTRRLERARSLPPDPGRQFRTFFAIESFGCGLEPVELPAAGVLDIAFLGTVALQAAGLPLDAVTATRASLMGECGSGYFAAASEAKRRFHRTLIETGAVDPG